MGSTHGAAVERRPAPASGKCFVVDVQTSCLFLRVGGLLLLLLHPLRPLAHQASLAPRIAQLPVGSLLGREVGNLALLNGDLVADREVLVVLLDLALVASLPGGLHLLGRSLTGLGGLGLAGEEDEASLVGLQALDVGLERLLGQVLAAGVDGDTDGGRQLAWDAGFL